MESELLGTNMQRRGQLLEFPILQIHSVLFSVRNDSDS